MADQMEAPVAMADRCHDIQRVLDQQLDTVVGMIGRIGPVTADKLEEIAPGLWWQIALDDEKAMGELEAMKRQFDEALKKALAGPLHPEKLAPLFGEVVRKLREKRGWTQEQLAERAEMNASYLGFVERGDNVPTLTIIIQIAEGLGIGPDELLRKVMKQR